MAPSPSTLPVIGILSHPVDVSYSTNDSYIAASYSKFVESAGARVIPLIYNESWKDLKRKLGLVNGVIFTGGSAKKGPYVDVAKKIYKEIKKKNDDKHHFPLLAICSGFQLVMKFENKEDILVQFNAKNHPSTLRFEKKTNFNGTVFDRFSKNLLEKLSTKRLVMQHHELGISPKKFKENEKLRSFFNILATSKDRDDKVYVSAVQAKKYPVIGLQFHPEKNAFEWGLPRIPHSEDAVQVSQKIANFFVREARKSSNRPSSQKVLDKLIYNHPLTYTGKSGQEFDQIYNFKLTVAG